MPWYKRGKNGQEYLYQYKDGRKFYIGGQSSEEALRLAEVEEVKYQQSGKYKLEKGILMTVVDSTQEMHEIFRTLESALFLSNDFYYRRGEWRSIND